MTVPPDEDDRAERLRQAVSARRAAARARDTGLTRRPDGETAYLGEMQRGLWLAHQLQASSAAYTLCSAFRVQGSLDLARLQSAFDAVVSRHRLLRSTFRADGDTVVQIIHPHATVPLETRAVGRGEGLEAATREARQRFDVEAGPLVRLRLIEEGGGDDRYLVLALHHLLADERSLGILWHEVGQAYHGRSPAVAPPEQYDDYVYWGRQGVSETRARELDYWRQRLDPLPDELRLPFEKPATLVAAEGRLLARTVGPETPRGIRRLAAAVGTTPFMVYAFAFRLLLHRYTDGQRVAFATPVSVRPHPAMADMVGYFLNPVLICTAVDEQVPVGAAVGDFVRHVGEAMAHGAVPFDAIAAELSPRRQPDRNPLFQAMFVYQEPRTPITLGEARLEPVVLDLGESKFDVTLFVTDGGDRAEIAAEYRADRFDERSMRRLLGHFATLAGHLAERLDGRVADVPMLDAAEEQELRAAEQGPPLAPGDGTTLPRLLVEQARRQPRATAVTSGSVSQSYGELERSARAIALSLSTAGVRPGDRVGVYLDRSARIVAAILGIHLAGCAYVPLDPTYPEARNRAVLEDAQVSAVVTTSAGQPRLPAGAWTVIDVDAVREGDGPSESLPPVLPDAPAYVLYTSGSTGRPKGVVVTHENLRASTLARLQIYDVAPSRFLLVPSIAFDSSVAGLFWTLLVGGTLVVPTDDEARDPRRLAQLVSEHGVNSLLCVPSLYAQLLRTGGEHLRHLEAVIVAGESCPSRLVDEHFQALPHVRLFNEYGPTEATVWSSLHEVTPADAQRPVAIGRPIPGTRIEVLDALGRRVPVGIPGHGWIAGPNVARGYWQRPDLTDERFRVAQSDSGSLGRRYRTGDRLAWTDDARLLFLGRDDEQIKVRGFRIEPGEIEAALLELPAVEQAAVVARAPGGRAGHSDTAEASTLVAFVVPRSPGGVANWREGLARQLPDFMVPSRLVELPALPLLPNGKVDRRRLRDMTIDDEAAAGEVERVPSTRELGLIALWEGLLGRSGVRLNDNFFELGGHSLLVVEMVAAIERDFGATLSPAEVFQHPTVVDLARRITERRSSEAAPYEHLFPIQPSGRKTPVIFAIPHFFTATFAQRFRGERPVYGLRGVSLRAEGNRGRWPTMTDLAEELVEEICRRFPSAPYILAGYSFGASMAVEAVRVMERRGIAVHRLYMIAPMPLDFFRVGRFRVQLDGLRKPVGEVSGREALRLFARANHPLSRKPYRRARRLLIQQPWRRVLCLVGRARTSAGLALTPRILNADVRVERFRLHAQYRPGPVFTPTVFFNAAETDTDAAATWRPWFHGPFSVFETPDPHDEASVEAARQMILEHLGDMGD